MGSLDPARFGISFEDMATDSIADLFARDDTGRYTELATYFAGTDWPEMSDADAEIALRRLVFGKVSERLFRSYKENDPNLGKVIRNIKDAVPAQSGCRLERIRGRLWIVLGDEEPLSGDRPVAPPEILEAYVTSALGNVGQTSAAIESLARFLAYHPHYRNGFPVSGLAKIVRSAFIRLGAAMVDEEEGPDDSFTQGEVDDAIEAAIDAVRSKMFSTYVSKGRIDPPTFELYVSTVSDVLASEYVHGTSSQHSHFDILATYKPSLSKTDYRDKHRNRVEYMVKLARTRLAELLAQDFVMDGRGQAVTA